MQPCSQGPFFASPMPADQARGRRGLRYKSDGAQAAQVRDTRARGIHNLMIKASDAVRT